MFWVGVKYLFLSCFSTCLFRFEGYRFMDFTGGVSLACLFLGLIVDYEVSSQDDQGEYIQMALYNFRIFMKLQVLGRILVAFFTF